MKGLINLNTYLLWPFDFDFTRWCINVLKFAPRLYFELFINLDFIFEIYVLQKKRGFHLYGPTELHHLTTHLHCVSVVGSGCLLSPWWRNVIRIARGCGESDAFLWFRHYQVLTRGYAPYMLIFRGYILIILHTIS